VLARREKKATKKIKRGFAEKKRQLARVQQLKQQETAFSVTPKILVASHEGSLAISWEWARGADPQALLILGMCPTQRVQECLLWTWQRGDNVMLRSNGVFLKSTCLR
jgi:hypothetical protein